MKEKIKTQKGFIQTPLLIGIIVSIVVTAGVGYGAFEYHKTSKIIGEAEQLAKEEKYEEAIGKLTLAQSSLIVEKLSINKQKIADEKVKNEQLFQDKSKYNQGLDEFDKGNWQGSVDILSELPESSFYYQKTQTKIEESKRMMAEEELGETKIAKKEAEEKTQQEIIKTGQAEAKAQQEETAKIAKEQELAVKEIEEKKMNADNDKDGLTYVQELSAGTSDLNPDSDGDGVPDNLDEHPAGGDRNLAQDFQWIYQNTKWEYTLSIPDDWYQYYKNKPRVPHGTVYVTFDDPYIKQIAQKIKTTAEANGYHTASFLLAFIQSLPDVADYYTKFDELPKYPIETIIDRNGDCEDMAYLFASLAQDMNMGSALIQFSDHMGAGAKTAHSQSGYYYPIGDDWYYYYETTGEGWEIGELPDAYKYQSAKVMVVGQTESQIVYPQYIKPCIYSSDFSGYYYDGANYYSDSQCYNMAYCLLYKGYYVNPQITASLYWDSSCSQIVVSGCYKSTSYPGYFYKNSIDLYSDSRCIQKATICRYSPNYSDTYYDGYNEYWDSSCTQKVVFWCPKSIYYPGYFFNSIDNKIYIDSQCTIKK